MIFHKGYLAAIGVLCVSSVCGMKDVPPKMKERFVPVDKRNIDAQDALIKELAKHACDAYDYPVYHLEDAGQTTPPVLRMANDVLHPERDQQRLLKEEVIRAPPRPADNNFIRVRRIDANKESQTTEWMWLKFKDYTLYWLKPPVSTRAEGCIRFLYDVSHDVTLEKIGETKIKFTTYIERVFEFDTPDDAQRLYDRCSKALSIRDAHGRNFQEDGRAVYSNVCSVFLENKGWIHLGAYTLRLLVDTKRSGGMPYVAAFLQSNTASHSYKFLVCPYIKPHHKEKRAWIIPKTMDIGTEYNQQTLAFRFVTESDAKIFKEKFDSVWASNVSPNQLKRANGNGTSIGQAVESPPDATAPIAQITASEA